MKHESGKICMAKLARIDHELAELDARRAELGAQRAAVWAELAEGETFDLRTMRKAKTPHRPTIGPVADIDRARARAALRESDLRRRLR